MAMKTSIRVLLAGAALALGTAACDGGGHVHELPEIDCAAVTPPTFANVNLLANCTNCHTSTFTGADRFGAPAGVNYDTYEVAVDNAEHGAAAVYTGFMPPPGGDVTEQDKQDFYAWALCGQPQ